MDSTKKWEDLDLSNDEVKRLTDALKNQEFRKLLSEYAEEISDPENRRKYEEEIAQLENEKGMDVKFVNPDPGYVIKTSSDGKVKTFINICRNEHIEKPKCSKKIGPGGKPGHHWSIPHSFAPVRDDTDKTGNKCKVIDFVVNPETYRMAESNFQFKKMLHDTAFEGIERQFEIKLDKKNIKFPKMNFKGTPTATVIRSKKGDSATPTFDPADPINKVPYPYSNKTSEELAKEREAEIVARAAKKHTDSAKLEETDNEYETPHYNIIHRGFFDLQDYRSAPDAKPSTRPKELVVEIHLPLLKSTASVDLDVMEKKLVLQSDKPAKYKLQLDLPYPVDEDKGGAKFDKTKHKLIVTLPVLPFKPRALINSETKQSDVLTNITNEPEHDMELKLPCNESFDQPLIQVLSSEENTNGEIDDVMASGDSSDVTAGGDSNDVSNREEPPEVKAACTSEEPAAQPTRFYAFPPYDYLQDDETVTVILDVKNVVRESVTKKFTHVNGTCCGLDISMASLGSGGFPMHYSCAMRFPENCVIEQANCYVDVGIHNMVVTFIKRDACLGQWETFQIGLNEDALEEKVFLSEKTLKAELDLLDAEVTSQEPFSADDMPGLEVKDMNSAQLSIEIKEGSGSRHSVSESGEDIEVVHEKQPPKLHGILKQRSVSESSDDLSASFNRQLSGDLSASFNRQISADLSASVNRQISAGNDSNSAVSESDENAESTSGDDTSERKKSVSFNEHVDRASFKQSQSVSSMRQTLKNKRKKQKKNEKRQHGRRHRNSSSEYSGDESTSHNVQMTSANDTLSTNQNASQDTSGHTDAAQTVSDKYEVNVHKQCNGSVELTDVTNITVVTKSDDVIKKCNGVTNNNVTQDDERTKNEYDSDDFEENKNEATMTSRPVVKDTDAPETILNWSEGPMDESLRPHCAVPLSNSVMFDLDVE